VFVINTHLFVLFIINPSITHITFNVLFRLNLTNIIILFFKLFLRFTLVTCCCLLMFVHISSCVRNRTDTTGNLLHTPIFLLISIHFVIGLISPPLIRVTFIFTRFSYLQVDCYILDDFEIFNWTTVI